MTGLEPARLAQLESAGARLRLDGVVAQMTQDLERNGIWPLLLKGPSVTRWLYGEDGSRGYVDCDLLLAPPQFDAAVAEFEAMGFRRGFDDRGMPEWWRKDVHAVVLVREHDGVTFDLHRWLPGVGLEPGAAWTILWAESSLVVVAGRRVRALGLPARALHLVLHAAQHGAEGWQALADLEQALSRLDEGLWRQAHALAMRLDALEGFAMGLRMTERGRRLAWRLELPVWPRSVWTVLCAGGRPPGALGLDQLAQATGIRARAKLMLQKVFPPPAYIRHWDPAARAGRAALVRAYVRRPLWLLARLPGGLRAWRQARRTVNDEQARVG